MKKATLRLGGFKLFGRLRGIWTRTERTRNFSPTQAAWA